MARPAPDDLYDIMEKAITGEGVREDFLRDYAANAEKNQLQLIGLQKYVCRVVAKRGDCG